MIDQYFLVLTTIDLFVLTFMCILTKLSETLNGKQKRGFFLAFALIGVISILEVIAILVDGAPVHLRCLNILSNYLGFGLSPAVAACLVYALDKKTVISRKFKAAVGCEVVYLLLLTALLPSGMVFSVSEDNVYARGPYFAFYIVMYLAALAYLAVSTIVTAWEFQNRSRVLLYPLIVFLAAETIIQIALPQLHVTWLCVTLLSVLYFIYCSEMWNQLDALTGLLNQNSYLNRTAEMRRSGEVLVVFDVDDFKQVNDRYGHVKGDICLAEIAACIKKALLPGFAAQAEARSIIEHHVGKAYTDHRVEALGMLVLLRVPQLVDKIEHRLVLRRTLQHGRIEKKRFCHRIKRAVGRLVSLRHVPRKYDGQSALCADAFDQRAPFRLSHGLASSRLLLARVP